jgi:ribosomal protein S8
MNIKIISFLSSLKNSSLVLKKNYLQINYTKRILVCVELLYKEGFILSYYVKQSSDDNRSYIFLKLRIVDGIVTTSALQTISKAKGLVYYKYSDLCRLNTKKKEFFVFTSKGLITLSECKKFRTGGMLAFSV